MMLNQLSSRAQVTARPACASSPRLLRAPKRTSLQIVNIGNINDPEKTKRDKEKKHSEGQWAEPSNKNPLEKKPIMRGEPGNASKIANKGENDDPLEGAKGAVDGAVEKAKEAVDNAKDAVSGDK